MNNLIAIDIGNTNITVGFFKGHRLLKKTKISTHAYSRYAKSFKGLLNACVSCPDNIEKVVVSSVVPLALARLVVELHKIFKHHKLLIVGRDIKVPIRNCYRVKSEVGADRLVNAYAAKILYGSPAVIIDFGTAITFDIVSKQCAYMGGLILPGIQMSLASLYKNTALLPKVELEESSDIIGRDTVNSMRGGILFGFGAMCDGLAAEYRKKLGRSLKVIATGGNAGLIKKYAKSIQHVDEDLTLKGLYLLSQKK